MGSGTVYGLIARVAFMVSGYALQISMVHWLPSPVEYGRFGVVLSLVTLARVVLSAGVPQAVSQFVASNPSAAPGIYRRGEAIQLGAACAVWAAFIAATPALSAWLGDPALQSLLWQVSPLIPLMALHQVGLGYIGGQLWFGLHALLTLTYSVARYALAATLVLLGFGLDGAIWGLVSSTVVVTLWSWLAVPRARTPSPISTREFLHFSWPLVVFSIGVGALLNLDLVLLKRFFPESPDIGFYSGAVNLGKAPYFVFYAFSTTTLPALAQFHAHGEPELARNVLARQMRFLVLSALPCSGVMAICAPELLQLVYRGGYAQAALPLELLAGSSFALSLMAVLASALTAVGKTKLSMSLVLASLPVQWLCGLWLIPKVGMSGAAASNFIATMAGLVVALVAVKRTIGNVVGLRAIGSASLSMLLAAGALRWLPPLGGGWLILKLGLGFTVYALALLLTGGVTRTELTIVARQLLRSARSEDGVS